MVRVGSAAPSFDCDAIIRGNLVHLCWLQIHEQKTLILLFNAIESLTHWPDYLFALNDFVEELEFLHAKIAVVCRAQPQAMLSWASRQACRGRQGSLVFPLIADSHDHLANLYGLALADGAMLWGQFVIDARGVVRQMAVSSFPNGTRLEELARSIRACGVPQGRGAWN
jgi:peroxiredoxin (alkyl hydroperoxide reductase subunit C)